MRRVTVYAHVMEEAAKPGKNYIDYKRDEHRQPILAVRAHASFHCFSTTYEELNDGVGHYPVAIVEFDDGSVDTVPLHLIKFDRSEG